MKFLDYCKDKVLSLLLFFLYFFLLLFFFSAFKISFYLYFYFVVFSLLFYSIVFFYEYIRRYSFYQHLEKQLEQLDKKYLVSELLTKPQFLEGEIVCETLYQTSKAMEEYLVEYRNRLDDFREYLELWIHEMKIPLSNIHFFLHNYDVIPKEKLSLQLIRLEDEVERVLFYVRSETAEKDYYIKSVSLKKIVHEAIQKQKDAFIDFKIGLVLEELDYEVKTDQKWLGFILGQIIQNSIQYRSKQPQIKISGIVENKMIRLVIKDNGIGIEPEDLPRVFEKTFTGKNGRGTSATGLGLYLSKRLMDQLGHKIEIESTVGIGTTVILSFSEDSYYDVV